jgi:hypothetical protein
MFDSSTVKTFVIEEVVLDTDRPQPLKVSLINIEYDDNQGNYQTKIDIRKCKKINGTLETTGKGITISIYKIPLIVNTIIKMYNSYLDKQKLKEI